MDKLKELNEVYKLISSIPVSGDAVDALAIAREKLRNIYHEIKSADEEKEHE